MKVQSISANKSFYGHKGGYVPLSKLGLGKQFSSDSVKVFIAGGKEVDRRVAQANENALKERSWKILPVTGGKEADKRVAQANENISKLLARK